MAFISGWVRGSRPSIPGVGAEVAGGSPGAGILPGGGAVGAEGIGAVGDDDGVAGAGILAEIEVGGEIFAAVDDEFGGGVLELVVEALAVGLGFAVEEGSDGLEAVETGELVEGDPAALGLGEAAVADDDEVDGQVGGVEGGFQPADEGRRSGGRRCGFAARRGRSGGRRRRGRGRRWR